MNDETGASGEIADNSGNQPSHICPNCGTPGDPKSLTGGSFLAELALWFCGFLGALLFGSWLILIVPAAYTLYRMTSRSKVCGTCKQPGLVPINSPAGIKLAENFKVSQ